MPDWSVQSERCAVVVDRAAPVKGGQFAHWLNIVARMRLL